jgi:CRP-like cAMP-binding protein
MMEDMTQKNKLIRDVNKNVKLLHYDQDAIIYNKGEVSDSIYMVIKGSVSLCLPIFKEN